MNEVVSSAPYSIFAYYSKLINSNVISLSFDTEYWVNRRMVIDNVMTNRLHSFLKDSNKLEDFPLSLGVDLDVLTKMKTTCYKSVLYQNIKFLYYEFSGIGFCILQKMQDFSHYSVPLVYVHKSLYNVDNTIFGHQNATLTSEGGFSWGTKNGGQNWISRNGLKNLELYEISRNLDDRGKKLVFNNRLYCPETGCQMYPVEV